MPDQSASSLCDYLRRVVYSERRFMFCHPSGAAHQTPGDHLNQAIYGNFLKLNWNYFDQNQEDHQPG